MHILILIPSNHILVKIICYLRNFANFPLRPNGSPLVVSFSSRLLKIFIEIKIPQLGKIFTVDKNAELYAYIFTFYGN